MSSDHDLRLATRADVAELARLLAPLGYALEPRDVDAVWPGWEAEGNRAWVAQGAHGLLGVVVLHRTTVLHRARPVGRITALAVDPAAQGRGLGRALVEAAERDLARAGCALIEITSHARRTAAHAFYEHLSYERTSVRFARTLPDEDTGR